MLSSRMLTSRLSAGILRPSCKISPFRATSSVSSNAQVESTQPDKPARVGRQRETPHVPFWEKEGGKRQRGVWASQENRRKFFDWIGEKMGVKTLDDWYSIKMDDFRKYHRGPLYLFGDSIPAALADAYPEHRFLAWKFSYVPKAFWESKQNQVEFFDWIGTKLGLQRMEDWYTVSIEQLEPFRGRRIMYIYGDSLSATLKAVYPNHKWDEWLFDSMTDAGKFWSSKENELKYVKWVEGILQISSLEQWYNIDQITIESGVWKGVSWLNNYNGSLQSALASVYSEHQWVPWQFRTGVEAHFWESASNRNKFVYWAEKQLGITAPEDWYKIRVADFERIGSGKLLPGRSLAQIVMAAYPDHSWDIHLFGG